MRSSGVNDRRLRLLGEMILIGVAVFCCATWVIFQYLPISSTSSIADINGENFVEQVDRPALLSDLMHLNRAGKHTLPAPQYSVRVEHRKHPSVMALRKTERVPHAMAVKFRSLVNQKIAIWYDDHQGGVENGHLRLGQETTTNTYVGHTFFFTDHRNKQKVYARHTMRDDQVLYIIEDPTHPAPKELKDQTDREVQFSKDYAAKHDGNPWRHYFGPHGPRRPPMHFMWPARQVGEVHAVTSNHGYWECDSAQASCQSLHPVHLELEVVSLAPRAFVISNFLSEFEADAIIALGRSRLHHSSVGDVDTGAFESDTRTSDNAWLPRDLSPITDTLFRRAADLLQIAESHLVRRDSAEDMQVVHYTNGQKYDAHHDWGVSGFPESRLITLLLYLTDMASETAGGETSFPKANHGQGFKIHPGKGQAVLFYNLLEDGNGDDLALHAALPCVEGEKWLANFWVWDPKMK